MAFQKAFASFESGNITGAVAEFTQLIEQCKPENSDKSNLLPQLYAYANDSFRFHC
jgi:hypothetical protein